MKSSSVSFIITVYNKKDYLSAMIDGLHSQLGEFVREFIFMDDGSTDGSLAVVKSLTQDWPNVTYLQQPNQGPAIATNNAVKHAQYDYLKMLDADDVLAPNATQLFLDAANKTGSAAVYSMMDFDHPLKMQAGMPVFPTVANDLKVHTVVEQSIAPMFGLISMGSSNAFYRREAFNAVGGCDERVFIQDVSLPLRIMTRYPISYFFADVIYYPDAVPGRLMGNSAQILHDATAALYRLIAEVPGVSRKDKKLAARKAAGRAWKWAHRKQGANILSRDFWRYACLTMRLPLSPIKALKRSQIVFQKNNVIRLPEMT